MDGRPTGTVTFLFTDIEGSTRLWESAPVAMRSALERHDELLASAIEVHGGSVFSTGGDGLAAAFSGPVDALGAAVAAQQAFGAEQWPSDARLRVRMGVHFGQVVERGGDYFGTPVNLCARLMSIGHGGQVLCTRAVAEIAGQAFSFRDLGEHRLRDLETPVPVMQVCAEGLAVDFAPLRSLEHHRTNLPHELSSFVGRAEEVSAVHDAIRGARVVSLIGVGGVGKTRLALRVGRALIADFRDGVWLCELASVRDRAGVPDAVAAALRYSPPFGIDLLTGLLQFLEHKDLLVILDNCEHLVAASAQFVTGLLASCPQLRVLVTSREPLGVAGERVHATPSLQLPSGTTASSVAESEAGALFVARASDARHAWHLTDRDAASVAEICRRLDGIPLALELAAARVAAMEPPDLAVRLDRRFELLAGSARGAIERHQTLRSTIDWSYDLLDPPEQLLLQQLSCFVGGLDLDALTAIASAGGFSDIDALNLMTALVSKSLVERDEARVGRYRLLETIRQYAAERLEAADRAAANRDHHADYYLTFARQMFEALRTREGFDAIERLVPDTPNIASAMLWQANRGDIDRCFELFSIAPPFLLASLPKSVTDLLARCLETLLPRDDASSSRSFSAACCAALHLLIDADEHRLLALEERVAAAPKDMFSALASTGPPGRRGDMAGGRSAAALALDLAGDEADPLFRSEILAILTIYEAVGDPVAGRMHAQESVALARKHGGELTLIYPLLALTLAASRTDVADAFAAADECSSIDRTSRRVYSSVAVGIAAHGAAEHGDLNRALPLWQTSIRELDRSGSRMSLAITVGTIGDAIAPRHPRQGLDLVCLAESGAIAPVGILANEYYTNARATASAFNETDLALRRDTFATLSYDDAIAYVLGTLEGIRKSS